MLPPPRRGVTRHVPVTSARLLSSVGPPRYGHNVQPVDDTHQQASAEWPPVNAEYVAAFQARGQSYEKTLPDPDLIQVIDFFSGCGGMSAGFVNTRSSRAAYHVLAGIDIDERALETYRLNLPATPVRVDVRQIASDPERLLSLVPGFDPDAAGPVVFIGCPPCQGFSAHRKKDDRDDDRNNLVLAFAKIVAHYRPDAVVIENVPEMLRGRFQGYWEAARVVLSAAGYVLDEQVLDLSEYGVPQRRRRAVIVGSLTGDLRIPAPVLSPERARTVREAIAHLPAIAAGQIDSGDPWHRAPAHIERILDKIRKIPPDGGDRRALSGNDQLACHLDVDAGQTPGFTDVYGRLRWDTPAVTITAKSSTPSCGRFIHPEQHRNISVREAALLQTFPHNFVFAGPFVHQYRQIGEAVPPLFARHIAMAVLTHLYPPSGIAVEIRNRIEHVRRDVASAIGTQAALPVAVDLFCGAGGLSLGFHAAGLRTAFALDNDHDAVATYLKNVGDACIGDVRDGGLAGRISDIIAGRRYIIAGGPPCQGFSQQRRGSDVDARNNLVLRYAELIDEMTTLPEAIVLENVMYLDAPRGRKIFYKFVRKVEDLGFHVFRHDLNSADFGLPQLRRRIVIVAVPDKFASRYEGPIRFTGDAWPAVGDLLRGIPEPDTGALPNHITARETEINVKRMAYVDMGRGRTAIPTALQLRCHRKYDGHLDVYGRLDWFGQARTLTGGFDSSSRGEYTHPYRNRSITAREAARLQGFPDWFQFEGNRSAIRRQIGNAVPPPLGFAIGAAVLEAVHREDTQDGRAA